MMLLPAFVLSLQLVLLLLVLLACSGCGAT
jgi:hypothetical protein